MKRSRIRLLTLALLLMMALVLAACGGDDEQANDEGPADDGDTEEQDGDDDEQELFDIDDFPDRGEEGDAADGGTLNFGLVSDTAFEGLLIWKFYGGVIDTEVLDWSDASLLDIDLNYQ